MFIMKYSNNTRRDKRKVKITHNSVPGETSVNILNAYISITFPMYAFSNRNVIMP